MHLKFMPTSINTLFELFTTMCFDDLKCYVNESRATMQQANGTMKPCIVNVLTSLTSVFNNVIRLRFIKMFKCVKFLP